MMRKAYESWADVVRGGGARIHPEGLKDIASTYTRLTMPITKKQMYLSKPKAKEETKPGISKIRT